MHKCQTEAPLYLFINTVKATKNKVNHHRRLQILQPGSISRIRKLNFNKKPIKTTEQVQIMNNLKLDNLVNIKITNNIGSETRTTIRLATLNARSVKNKDQIIVEEFTENGIDIALLTETWLKTDTPKDQACINQSDLKQSIFEIQQHNQPGNKKGGGVALLHQKKSKPN